MATISCVLIVAMFFVVIPGIHSSRREDPKITDCNVNTIKYYLRRVCVMFKRGAAYNQDPKRMDGGAARRKLMKMVYEYFGEPEVEDSEEDQTKPPPIPPKKNTMDYPDQEPTTSEDENESPEDESAERSNEVPISHNLPAPVQQQPSPPVQRPIAYVPRQIFSPYGQPSSYYQIYQFGRPSPYPYTGLSNSRVKRDYDDDDRFHTHAIAFKTFLEGMLGSCCSSGGCSREHFLKFEESYPICNTS